MYCSTPGKMASNLFPKSDSSCTLAQDLTTLELNTFDVGFVQDESNSLDEFQQRRGIIEPPTPDTLANEVLGLSFNGGDAPSQDTSSPLANARKRLFHSPSSSSHYKASNKRTRYQTLTLPALDTQGFDDVEAFDSTYTISSNQYKPTPILSNDSSTLQGMDQISMGLSDELSTINSPDSGILDDSRTSTPKLNVSSCDRSMVVPINSCLRRERTTSLLSPIFKIIKGNQPINYEAMIDKYGQERFRMIVQAILERNIKLLSSTLHVRQQIESPSTVAYECHELHDRLGPRVFTTFNQLTAHLVKAHFKGLNLFACRKCSSIYSDSAQLIRHLRRHKTMRPGPLESTPFSKMASSTKSQV